MGRIKTFTNGGSILPADLNSIQDDYEKAFSAYQLVHEDSGALVGAVSPGGVFFVNGGSLIASNGAGTAPGHAMFYFNPADFFSAPRACKLRMQMAVAVNNTAPGCSFTGGIYEFTAPAGGAGAMTFTAVSVAASALAIAAPAANSRNVHVTADFDAPVAGWYGLAVALNGGGSAANSVTLFSAQLQVRQV
jgi:hypothetical protein